MKLFNWNTKTDDSKAVVKTEQRAIATKEHEEIVASIILNGDISKLNAVQRVAYVKEVCGRLGIDWSTQPFQILRLNGKEKLYASKDATDQLRKVYGVSIIKLEKSLEQGLCVFIATARDRSGKEDTSSGAVSIKDLTGEALANAIMKAETKAKRRVTLSICGLGMLDENEVDSIAGAQTRDITHIEATAAPLPKTSTVAEQQPSVHVEPSVEDLHNEFLKHWVEYRELVGEGQAGRFHPDNWLTPRGVKNYQAGITAIKDLITKTKQQRKEAVNG
jgi:hypothetical protein